MHRFINLCPGSAALAILVLVVAPTAQARKSVKPTALKAQIVGQPYPAGHGRTAVPVLVAQKTAKRAGLASGSGIVVIVAKRTLVVRRQRYVRTRLLRVYDRIQFRSIIRPAARRAAAW